MVISDPPYNIGFGYNTFKDNMSEEAYIKMLGALASLRAAIILYPRETMRYLVPALGAPDDVMIWCYASNLPRQARLINIYNTVADRTAVRQPYRNLSDKRIQARIEAGSKGARMYDWFTDINLVKNVSQEKGIHPCPVPVALMERIILMTTQPGDTVFDPFMGGGTTGIAALNTGRNFIGCELDGMYFKYAEERLAAHLTQAVP